MPELEGNYAYFYLIVLCFLGAILKSAICVIVFF